MPTEACNESGVLMSLAMQTELVAMPRWAGAMPRWTGAPLRAGLKTARQTDAKRRADILEILILLLIWQLKQKLTARLKNNNRDYFRGKTNNDNVRSETQQCTQNVVIETK